MSEWISVKDRLPEYEVSVLAAVLDTTTLTYFQIVSVFWKSDLWASTLRKQVVTHWMPLPALPDRESEMSEHPKHKFIESDLVNFCGYGMVVVDGYIDDSNGCRESRDHPIHEPEATVSEGKEEQEMRDCTKCFKPIEKGQPYCKTRKGWHHFKCSILSDPPQPQPAGTKIQVPSIGEPIWEGEITDFQLTQIQSGLLIPNQGFSKAMARQLAALQQSHDACVVALTRAERKLRAYVGVCKGDKELTDTILPMAQAALANAEKLRAAK